MHYSPGSIISYREMCDEEQSSLQRGMNFRLHPTHSVILMSLRPGAPYADQISEDGLTLTYEGHDVPKNSENPIPKIVDQVLFTAKGSKTQNGHFYKAAETYRNGQATAERVRVYEKIQKGIWVYAGLFLLIDAWAEENEERNVFKFKLKQTSEILDTPEPENDESIDFEMSPGRLIPSHIKLEVYKRDGGRCALPECRAEDHLHYDHILPFSKGGDSTNAENIQLLCARHNLQKSNKIE